MYIKIHSTAITTSIMSLDIIHRLVYFLKTVIFLFQNTVFWRRFYPRPQVKSTQLGPVVTASP